MKNGISRVRRRGEFRFRFWVHALIVGVLLTGQLHLYTAEFLHHHEPVNKICKIAHNGGIYLHTTPGISPICPLCQVVRNGAVRPSVRSPLPKPDKESTYRFLTCKAGYSANFSPSLQARAPPLFS